MVFAVTFPADCSCELCPRSTPSFRPNYPLVLVLIEGVLRPTLDFKWRKLLMWFGCEIVFEYDENRVLPEVIEISSWFLLVEWNGAALIDMNAQPTLYQWLNCRCYIYLMHSIITITLANHRHNGYRQRVNSPISPYAICLCIHRDVCAQLGKFFGLHSLSACRLSCFIPSS